MFWTLCEGGALVVPDDDQRADAAALADLIGQCGVTHVLAIPSLLQELLAQGGDRLRSLRTVIAAGEPCPANAGEWHRRLNEALIYNEYGPTEATVWCTVAEVDSRPGPAPIGRPISGAHCQVLDHHAGPQPVGAWPVNRASAATRWPMVTTVTRR